MPRSLDRVPEPARTAWIRLRDELVRAVGDDLVAIWAYGGTIRAEGAARTGDLDTFVVVRRTPDPPTVAAIQEALTAVAAETGVDWDTWVVVEDDARRPDMPRHAYRERLNESWAIDRAHWLAGRYVLLHGVDPADIVPIPSQAELAEALDNETEHLERHVAAGDTDPYEATYAFLNGSRIVHAVETGEVAISKREAGVWGLDHLDVRWRPALVAARRAYDGCETAGDAQLLAREMAPFVAMVRERLRSR